MWMKAKILFLLLFAFINILAADYKIIESNDQYIKVEFNFNNNIFHLKDTSIQNKIFTFITGGEIGSIKAGDPWLPYKTYNFGIPQNSVPSLQIIDFSKDTYNNKIVIPFPIEDPYVKNLKGDNPNPQIYSNNKLFPAEAVVISGDFGMRYLKVLAIRISPFQFNPVNRQLIFNKRIVIKLIYNNKTVSLKNIIVPVHDKSTEDFISHDIVNKDFAKNWIGKQKNINSPNNLLPQYWYNPAKNYFKIYLKDKGVYRITYNQLVDAGVPLQGGISVNRLALYNNGEMIPIDLKTSNDSVFNQGDYFQFIGNPPTPSPFCTSNIYNIENVYWFTFENDSSAFYKVTDGYPDIIDNAFQNTWQTIHFERDTIYERLGYAPDGKRDHWFWGSASGANGVSRNSFVMPFNSFEDWYLDSINNKIKLRVNLQGITFNSSHNVKLLVNGKLLDSLIWFDQTNATFERDITIPDFNIYPANSLQFLTNGNAPNGDEVRINWVEFDYYKNHKAKENNLYFQSSPGMLGPELFSLWNWKRNNINIYIPQRSEVIRNARNLQNQYYEYLFKDSLTEIQEYYCVADDYFLPVDSIRKDISSDLRNTNNNADYIIIYHANFLSAALRLAAFRQNNLAGYSSPRIKIVNVQDIYDEFSFGLQNPYALRDFCKYTFQNWQTPAPAYICLLGDMSWDYRNILPTSRPNFIASIPHQQIQYGEAVSDNDIVAFNNNSFIPQMAIGRLSCETLDEANVLIDKVINYPGDNSKDWKRNIFLIGGGETENDETEMRFNEASQSLQDNFIAPAGYMTSKIFCFPITPEQQLFKGTGPEIRTEFNKGCVVNNFYGHGGGSQWDLIFLNDDIYTLQNGNQMPMIFSVTCYTAHFDNQNVFGEQFIKVPGKGAIGFWGNTGLTFWSIGPQINQAVYKHIFNNSEFVVGDAIRDAKADFSSTDSQTSDHLALLSLLGDPALELALPKKPDFRIKSDGITIDPLFPLINNSLIIKLNIDNVGRKFTDSVSVKINAYYSDTSFSLGYYYLKGFSLTDSLVIPWTPTKSGNVRLEVVINQDNLIDELDHSDNIASANYYIYSIQEPNIVKPINGFSTTQNKINITIADVGYYIGSDINYCIQIDTSNDFIHPFLTDSLIKPNNALVKWQSPALIKGNYFWRVKLSVGNNSSNWSGIRSFGIKDSVHEGYYVEGSQLKTFDQNNMLFNDSINGLILNSSFLPPRPYDDKLLDTFRVQVPEGMSGLSSITTDGKYVFIASMAFFQSDHKSKIYKLGSGNNETIRGFNYGEIPGVEVSIWQTMFYFSDGFIYAATGDHLTLLKINPTTGDTVRVNIPDGLLNEKCQAADGGFWLTSDGRYVYNLAYYDTMGNHKYLLRIFDPLQNWAKVGNDEYLGGSSYDNFCGFFVADSYLYPYENVVSGYMRRINLQTNTFESEWLTSSEMQRYFPWSYDWVNNEVFTSVYSFNYPDLIIPRIFKFVGKYKQSTGTTFTPPIGPSSKWINLKYSIDNQNPSSSFSSVLLGLNHLTSNWDTLLTKPGPNTPLDNISSQNYNYLKVGFSFKDTSINSINPNILKNVSLDYQSYPEIYLNKLAFIFKPDTLLQGFTTTLNLGVNNIGYIPTDSLLLNFYLDGSDSSIYRTFLSNISVDSTKSTSFSISTSALSPATNHSVKAKVISNIPEFFQFNNSINQTFYVSRDSVNPLFNITFDGKEIVNDDIVSAKPEIIITIKDNSPLPMDTSIFSTFAFDDVQLSFTRPDLKFSYTPYPNSQATVKWTPTFSDGKHTLEILAKDPSGNFFDSVSHKYEFFVYNQPDLLNVFNYPNPFKNDTYFTFELHGQNPPEEFRIKVFTVAGRLIKDILIPQSELRVGFNRIYWNGRDQDGDEVANGVYFYKIIAKNNGVVKTTTEKMARIR
jgi:hypothetical protein